MFFTGLQQKEEDVSSVQESTHQTEGTREVPKPTNRGTYIHTHMTMYILLVQGLNLPFHVNLTLILSH